MPVVVVSPHLDDAVMSCGQLLAANPGSIVVTVFAGRPADGRRGSWDERSFGQDDDPMILRRDEDRRALARLDATPVHLDFLDHQYRDGERHDISTIELHATLAAELDRCEGTVYLPLGADHVDHRLVCAAGMEVLAEGRWCLYEELPYARGQQGWVAERCAAIGGLRRCAPRLGPLTEKAAAVEEYQSQLRALATTRILVYDEERYWTRSS
jgi:LmbE family N-acetylglucosaminyl deacetylase